MKKTIRQEILQKRKLLSQEELLSKSKTIFQSIKNLSIYQAAQNVMLYIDFRNEVKTGFIMEDLLTRSKGTVVPISVIGTREMILSQVLDPEKELARSSYGILEPKPEYIRKINPAILDLVIVPGIAFDSEGYRIGYGGGYYDYFFSTMERPIVSIALAFDLQIIETVPKEDYDRPVDYIITESRIIDCSKLR